MVVQMGTLVGIAMQHSRYGESPHNIHQRAWCVCFDFCSPLEFLKNTFSIYLVESTDPGPVDMGRWLLYAAHFQDSSTSCHVTGSPSFLRPSNTPWHTWSIFCVYCYWWTLVLAPSYGYCGYCCYEYELYTWLLLIPWGTHVGNL